MLTIILFSAPLHNHSVSGPMPTVILLAPRQQLLFLPHVNNHFVFGPAPTNYYSCPMPTTILFSAPRQQLLFLSHANNHFVFGPAPQSLCFRSHVNTYSSGPTPKIIIPAPCQQSFCCRPHASLFAFFLSRPRVINNFIRPHTNHISVFEPVPSTILFGPTPITYSFSAPCHQQLYSPPRQIAFSFLDPVPSTTLFGPTQIAFSFHSHSHSPTHMHAHSHERIRTHIQSLNPQSHSHAPIPVCMYELTRTPPLGLTNDSHVHDSSRIHTQTGP